MPLGIDRGDTWKTRHLCQLPTKARSWLHAAAALGRKTTTSAEAHRACRQSCGGPLPSCHSAAQAWDGGREAAGGLGCCFGQCPCSAFWHAAGHHPPTSFLL